MRRRMHVKTGACELGIADEETGFLVYMRMGRIVDWRVFCGHD
jgi:hypothetical protein